MHKLVEYSTTIITDHHNAVWVKKPYCLEHRKPCTNLWQAQRSKLLDSEIFDTCRWWDCQPGAPAAFTPRKLIWYVAVNVLEEHFGSIIIGHLNLVTVCSDG